MKESANPIDVIHLGEIYVCNTSTDKHISSPGSVGGVKSLTFRFPSMLVSHLEGQSEALLLTWNTRFDKIFIHIIHGKLHGVPRTLYCIISLNLDLNQSYISKTTMLIVIFIDESGSDFKFG